jgi:hypothetical protein
MSIASHKCHRADCRNRAKGRSKYCSKTCSAITRNRRYYRTFNGRWKKHEWQSRYFQKHKHELYAKKNARLHRAFLGYLEQEITHQTPAKDPEVQRMQYGRSVERAKFLSRFFHDFHPSVAYGPRGRMKWIFDLRTGRLRASLDNGFTFLDGEKKISPTRLLRTSRP